MPLGYLGQYLPIDDAAGKAFEASVHSMTNLNKFWTRTLASHRAWDPYVKVFIREQRNSSRSKTIFHPYSLVSFVWRQVLPDKFSLQTIKSVYKRIQGVARYWDGRVQVSFKKKILIKHELGSLNVPLGQRNSTAFLLNLKKNIYIP